MRIFRLCLFWSLWYFAFSPRTIISPLLPLIQETLALTQASAGALYLRITSYNVCYTKLLRNARRWRCFRGGSGGPALRSVPGGRRRSNARRAGFFSSAKALITSYSIHYTNLYDPGHAGQRPALGADSHQTPGRRLPIYPLSIFDLVGYSCRNNFV